VEELMSDTAPSLDTEPTPQPPPDSPGRFLSACLRLLSLRRADGSALVLDEGPIALVACAAVLLWVGIDRWQADAAAIFYPEGVLALAWFALLLVVTVWVCSRLTRPRIEFQRVFAIAIVLVPIVVTLWWLLLAVVAEDSFHWAVLLLIAYGMLYLERGLRSITARAQPLAVLASLLLVLSSNWVSDAEYFNASLWDVPAAEDAVGVAELDAPLTPEAESLLFSQPARIDAAIDQFTRPATLGTAGFFVGFAGVGEQRVFATEIALAAQVLARRFPIDTRSIQLVNDQRDTTSLPIASPTTLRYTLAQVARRMQLDRDVLFLALSSHGSSDGVLEVSNPSLSLNNLSVAELASALDESGIQWRVVIISACFAGQFIESLTNDHTIVITAAAADRSSFGCADDRDLTYFGEAFYRDILPSAPTLRTAFNEMKAVIAAREKREKKKPSRPQAYFGKAMEAYLEKLAP
jgi:hypothetical protein